METNDSTGQNDETSVPNSSSCFGNIVSDCCAVPDIQVFCVICIDCLSEVPVISCKAAVVQILCCGI